MGEHRHRRHRGRRHEGRRHEGRRHERERVSARVHNSFETEDSGEVEKFQQKGNALALNKSHNNKVEQENKFKSEED